MCVYVCARARVCQGDKSIHAQTARFVQHTNGLPLLQTMCPVFSPAECRPQRAFDLRVCVSVRACAYVCVRVARACWTPSMAFTAIPHLFKALAEPQQRADLASWRPSQAGAGMGVTRILSQGREGWRVLFMTDVGKCNTGAVGGGGG